MFHPSKIVSNEFILDPDHMPNQREFMTFDTLTPLDENLLGKSTIKERTMDDLNFWRWLKTWRNAENSDKTLEPGKSTFARLASRYFRL